MGGQFGSEYIQYTYSQYIPFCDKGKWGFATTDGKITIACLYEAADFYSDDNLAKVKKGGKYGYINKNGVTVIPFEYDDCYRIYEVYEREHSVGIKINPSVHLNDGWVPSDTKNNRYIVFKNKNYGIISLMEGKPKVRVPFNYSKIQFDLNKKIFHCSNIKGMQYFNIDGQRLTQEQVDKIERIEFSTGGMGESDNIPKIIKINGKVGVIQQPNNSWGEANYDTIVPVIYDDIITEKFDDNYFSGNDVFGVRIGKKWGIVDRKKNVLLPINFDSINFELSKDSRHWAEYKRMFVVKKNDQWGILGKKNDSTDTMTTFLPFEYKAISKIYYSYLLVQKLNKFQVFNIDTYNLISNKSYSSITKYEHESVNSFYLFQVTNKLGQTVYLGKNGVEFFTD
jgi:hypothetical protein